MWHEFVLSLAVKGVPITWLVSGNNRRIASTLATSCLKQKERKEFSFNKDANRRALALWRRSKVQKYSGVRVSFEVPGQSRRGGLRTFDKQTTSTGGNCNHLPPVSVQCKWSSHRGICWVQAMLVAINWPLCHWIHSSQPMDTMDCFATSNASNSTDYLQMRLVCVCMHADQRFVPSYYSKSKLLWLKLKLCMKPTKIYRTSNRAWHRSVLYDLTSEGQWPLALLDWIVLIIRA